jgi:anti-sigma factor RsiW
MQQTNIHLLLHPYFDGELDYSESLIFEEHLTDCPDCSQALEEQKKLRSILEQISLRYTAPKELKRTVQSSLKRNTTSRKVIIPWSWRMYGIAASIAIAFFILWTFIPRESGDHEKAETDELVSSHLRSLMASHLFDIASSDQHTVKPWFAGKLDFSPVVKDFSSQGFQLIGGRLDYIGGKPVAALVYQHEKHIINVFECIISPNNIEKHTVEHNRGFNLLADQSGEIRLWLVSDLNAEELGQLAILLR